MRDSFDGFKAFIFRYHAFINIPITFLINSVVSCVPFVRSMNLLVARGTRKVDEANLATCPECFSEISMDTNRCQNRTSWVRGAHVAIALTPSYVS